MAQSIPYNRRRPMIRIDRGDRWQLVQQDDHAHLSGEILSLWVADGLPEHPRRADVVFAARNHDNGWREEDSVPRLDPESGGPHTFLTLPAEARPDIWRRGIARYARERPYAAALIHLHALALHRSLGEGDDDSLVGEVEASLQALVEHHGLDLAELEADYPLIDLTDVASLAACRQLRGAATVAGREILLESDDLIVDPFPLAGATRFRLPYREIEARRYSRGSDIGNALAAAPWRELEVRVCPPPDGRG
ncbi:MAG: DUF3891 family protein [Thermoanaerobaculia bacterium]|nr:DUF3891 family protein [Thermoanaerobaculia bacterium]